jgi:hypothetical protein
VDPGDNEVFMDMMEDYFSRPAQHKMEDVRPHLHYQVQQGWEKRAAGGGGDSGHRQFRSGKADGRDWASCVCKRLYKHSMEDVQPYLHYQIVMRCMCCHAW